MDTIKLKFAITLFGFAMLFASCSDEAESIKMDKNNLVGEVWTFSNAEPAEEGSDDLIELFLVDTYIFMSDGSYQGLAQEQLIIGEWTYSDGLLIIDGEANEVVELTSDRLTLLKEFEGQITYTK